MIRKIFSIANTHRDLIYENIPSEPFDTGAPPIDLNGDGNLDLVLLSGLIPNVSPLSDGDQAGHILFTQDDGTFKFAGGDQPLNIGARYTEYADFNNDGHLDIFIVDSGYDAPPHPGHKSVLLLSNGKKGYIDASHRLPDLMDFSHGLAVADVNNDGWVDVFVSVFGGGEVEENYILINRGPNKDFKLRHEFVPDSVAGVNVRNTQTSAFADLDGDGNQDLIIGSNYNWNENRPDPSVVFFGDGSGQFTDDNAMNLPGPNHAFAANAHDIQPIDVDADGDMDLLMYLSGEPGLNPKNDEGWEIQLLINDGEGNFTDETNERIEGRTFSFYGALSFMHQVDLNGDGLIDFMPSAYSYWIEKSDQLVLQLIATGNGTFESLTMGQIVDAHGMTGVPNGSNEAVFEASELRFVTANGKNYWQSVGYQDETIWMFQWEETKPTLVDLKLTANAHTRHWAGHTGDDLLLGSSHKNKLKGMAGDDVIKGRAGNDVLNGGNGADRIQGDAGADKLLGKSGNDKLFGGGENDRLLGHNGADKLNGGDDNDMLLGGAGNDRMFGNKGADKLNGGKGNDRLSSGPGADTLSFSGKNIGNDVVTDFQLGVDTLQLDNALWVGNPGKAKIVNKFASVVDGNVVFDFSGDNSVTLLGVNTLSGLPAGLDII